MSELPSGWAECLLEDLLGPLDDGKVLQQGWSPQCDSVPATEGEWGVLKTTAVQDGYFLEVENKKLPLKLPPKPELEVKAGDLLMTCAGPRSRCGVICHVEETREKLIFSGKIYRFRPNKQYVAPKFLTHLLRTTELKEKIDNIKTGISESGMNMTRDRFFSLQVRLAPFDEQFRIAKKLDELLAQVDTLKARIDAIPDLLKRFRQSVLAAAASGRLTEDWRTVSDTDELLISWQDTKLSELCALVTSGSRGWADYYSESGAIFIRSQDINTDDLDITDTAFVKLPESSEGKRTRVQAQDILITITGANVGKVARVKQAVPEAYVSQHVALVRLQNPEHAPFIEIFLKDIGSGRGELTELAYGGGKPGLNLSNIRDLAFALPSRDEQFEIVRRVEQLFTFADQLEAKVASAKTRIDLLAQSILAKAFRGELVPQDPNDEPASVLLERIKAQRVATSKDKRGRKNA